MMTLGWRPILWQGQIWDGETEVYSNGPAHITKMAAMPIYGKNL